MVHTVQGPLTLILMALMNVNETQWGGGGTKLDELTGYLHVSLIC